MLFKLTKAGAAYINNPSIKEGDFVLFQRTLSANAGKDHQYRGHLNFLHWMACGANAPKTVQELANEDRKLQVLDDEGNRYVYTLPAVEYRRFGIVYNKDTVAFRIPLLPQHVEACLDFPKEKYVLPRIVVGITTSRDPGFKYDSQYVPQVIENTNAVEVKRFGEKVNKGNAAFLALLEEKNPELMFPKEVKAISVAVLSNLYKFEYTAKEEAVKE